MYGGSEESGWTEELSSASLDLVHLPISAGGLGLRAMKLVAPIAYECSRTGGNQHQLTKQIDDTLKKSADKDHLICLQREINRRSGASLFLATPDEESARWRPDLFAAALGARVGPSHKTRTWDVTVAKLFHLRVGSTMSWDVANSVALVSALVTEN